MTRLTHSYGGYLRYMQMSTTQLFVFVEGIQCDPYFYANVCLSALGRSVTYQIESARQIPGDSGGKQSLLKLFSFLRRRRSLVSDLGGKKTACVFFVDKDVDDIRRSKRNSKHICYTEHYDVQNHVFLHGDLVRGGAAAASVDPQRLDPVLGDAEKWSRGVAALWIDWLSICLAAIEVDLDCEANYGVCSRVQIRPSGQSDGAKFQSLVRGIAQRAVGTVPDFAGLVARSRRKVLRYFSAGHHHKIFKGKWYAIVLADEIDIIMNGGFYDKNGLSGRLPCAVAATLDFTRPWADHFKRPLVDVAALLTNSH